MQLAPSILLFIVLLNLFFGYQITLSSLWHPWYCHAGYSCMCGEWWQGVNMNYDIIATFIYYVTGISASPYFSVDCLETDFFSCHTFQSSISPDSVHPGDTWETSVSSFISDRVHDKCVKCILSTVFEFQQLSSFTVLDRCFVQVDFPHSWRGRGLGSTWKAGGVPWWWLHTRPRRRKQLSAEYCQRVT